MARRKRNVRSEIERAHNRADLFRLDPVIPAFGAHPHNNFIDGVAALARHSEDWVPPSHNPRKQFHHLACHLLAPYDVPTFMDAAFFTSQMPEAGLHQAWFKYIGSGKNIRTADLPVALNKKSAHCFLAAPADLSIAHALRWGQVLGQGGSPALARAVIGTRLGQSFENEDFWSTAILFFVNNPMLDPAHVGPIVDFIYDQKYVPQQIVLPGGGVEQRPPAQPNFSMKSRSIPKLLRQVDEWHEALARQVLPPDAEAEPDRAGGKKSRVRPMSWGASSIGESEQKQEDKPLGETLTWSIKELLSNHELGAEGREMGHCVYTYAKSCRNGSTSLWSLGVEDGKGHRHRILTIAVDLRTRTITQIRGRYNVLPNAKNNKEPRARLPEDAAPLAESARAVDEPRIHQQALLTLSMATDGIKVNMTPSHPGDFIRTEIIEELGLNVTRAAEILGVRRATLSDLLNGNAALSPEMALRIEKAFGVGMDMLLRMQTWYDASQMRARAEGVSGNYHH